MAYKRINQTYFMADNEADLASLPKAQMGAECYVIETACEYKCNSQGEWIIQKKNGQTPIAPPIDLSKYATKEYVNNAVPSWEEIHE